MFGWLLRKKSLADYPDHISSAAFRWINIPWVRPSYLGGQLDQIDRIKAHSAERRKAAEAIADDDTRGCVLAWLDYYDSRDIPKAEAELRDQTSRKELDAYKVEREEEERKIKEALSSMP